MSIQIYKLQIPFCESDKNLCEKIREDMTVGPSIVFTRKNVVDETFIRISSAILFLNVCLVCVSIMYYDIF